MITYPTNNRDVINNIREAIGRDITFITKIETDCPSCDINPVSNTSTNPYCPICSGIGYLYTLSGYTVGAHITWGKADITSWQSVGSTINGDCLVQVESLPETLNAINNSDYVVVEDKRLTIRKRIPRGTPTINRYLLDLVEQSDD